MHEAYAGKAKSPILWTCCKIDSMSTSDVLSDLQKALESAKQAHAKLEEAQAKLQPLEDAAKEADATVQTLMVRYQSISGVGPATGRRGAGTKRKYKERSAEDKIETQFKRSKTKAMKAGQTESEAVQTANATCQAMAKKLGVSWRAKKK